jgi:hypothetical protein
MKHPIPDAALAQHIAVLGKAGSGKTYTAKGVVENILTKKGRVCIIDPTGAWHGLRSSANGKRAGYPVVIFGGEHSDLPLGQEHGEAMAEIIGTSTTPTILDTSLMRVGERTRFFTDFAEGLLRKNKGPLHLIIDEAHLFAPQGKVNDPQSGKMVNAANNLVSLGRLRGLRVMLITQRPAKLHKDSLTQVETLIAMRLIAPQDRKAVEEWIKDNADQNQAKEIMSSLAKLPTGTGWIWAPELDILKRTTFPKIKTLDTSRAPIHAKKGKGPVLAPINRKAIEQKLRDAAIEVVANDPRNLKAEIAALKKQLAAKPVKAEKPGIDRAAIKAAEAAAYAKGVSDGYEKAIKISAGNTASLLKALNSAQAAVQSIEQWAKKKPPAEIIKPKIPRLGIVTPAVIRETLISSVSKLTPPKTNGKAHPEGDLTSPQRRIMASLGFWAATGQGQPTRAQVAAVAGYKPGSGNFNNIVGGLTTQGYVAVPAPGRLATLQGGFSLTPSEACSVLTSVFDGPQQRLVSSALATEGALTREELAEKSGYQPGSGNFNNIAGKLTTMEVLTKPGPGKLELSDWAREVLS